MSHVPFPLGHTVGLILQNSIIGCEFDIPPPGGTRELRKKIPFLKSLCVV